MQYLTDRTQGVFSDGVKSGFRDIRKRCPTGVDVWPYTFYGLIIYMPNKKCNIHLFADDTVVYAVAPMVDQAVSELLPCRKPLLN